MVYDVLELNGSDYRRVPLTARRILLQGLIPDSGLIRLSPLLPEKPQELMQAVQGKFEGVTVKQKQSPYDEGQKSGNWRVWNASKDR